MIWLRGSAGIGFCLDQAFGSEALEDATEIGGVEVQVAGESDRA